MAFSVNKVILLGNLGKDAETRYTTTNTAVTTFSLATVSGYKDKSGQWQNETTWHDIVLWSASDFLLEQLKKGKKFYIEGRIKKEEYTDKEGVKRYPVKIIAEQVIPLENNGHGNGTQNRNEDVYNSSGSSSNSGSDENDDLPF